MSCAARPIFVVCQLRQLWSKKALGSRAISVWCVSYGSYGSYGSFTAGSQFLGSVGGSKKALGSRWGDNTIRPSGVKTLLSRFAAARGLALRRKRPRARPRAAAKREKKGSLRPRGESTILPVHCPPCYDDVHDACCWTPQPSTSTNEQQQRIDLPAGDIPGTVILGT